MTATTLLITLAALALIGLLWEARNDRKIQQRRVARRLKTWV